MFNIGQKIVLKEDLKLKGEMSEEEVVIKKGSTAFIDTDGNYHFTNGKILLGDKEKVKGYSVKGLAEWVWIYIKNNTCVNKDLLEDYDETPENFKEQIEWALEELGFYNHEGNLS